MSDLIVCEDCGTAFEADSADFPAVCPDCEHRVHPRAGCC